MVYFVTNRTDHIYKCPYNIGRGAAISILRRIQAQGKMLAVDIETNGLEPFEADMLLVTVGDYNTQIVFDATSIDLSFLYEFLSTKHNSVIGHNLKFDYKFIKHHLDIDITHIYDTMLVEQILSQGDKTRRHNLEAVVSRRVRRVLTMPKSTRLEFVDMTTESEFDTRHIMYAAEDIKNLQAIRTAQLPLINMANLGKRLDIEMKLVPVIANMELRGILLNTNAWKDNIRINTIELSRYEKLLDKELLDIAVDKGIDDKRYTSVRGGAVFNVPDLFSGDKKVTVASATHVNFGSEKQVKQVFRDFNLPVPMDKDGKVSIGREVLEQYNVINHNNIFSTFIENLLIFVKIRKKLSSFGESFLDMIHPVTGAIHTIYKQCSTATGRFASGDTKNGHPNMAQIPKDNQYRIPFKARAGYKLMTIDFTGCELTILASASKDKKLISLLMDDNADLHTYLANAAWRAVKKDPTYEVTEKERTTFKGVTFGLVYGATEMRIAALLRISLKDAKIVVATLRNEMPGVFHYLDSVAYEAIHKGYVVFNQRTNSRRVFKEALDAYRNNQTVPYKRHGIIGRAAKNAPIQGTNADLMKESMVEVADYLIKNQIDGHILLQVYDELVIELPDDDKIYEHAEKIQYYMETTADKYLDTTLGIHMRSEYKIANTWQK